MPYELGLPKQDSLCCVHIIGVHGKLLSQHWRKCLSQRNVGREVLVLRTRPVQIAGCTLLSGVLQGQGSLQMGIARFVGGSGTRSDKDAFLNKLARTHSDQLPSVTGQLTVTAEDGQGVEHVCCLLLHELPAGGMPQRTESILTLEQTACRQALARGSVCRRCLQGASASAGCSCPCKSRQWAAGQRWSSEWLVCNALGGGKAQAMAAASRGQSSRGLVPWVGVAAQLSGGWPGSQPTAQGGELVAAGSGKQRRGLVSLPWFGLTTLSGLTRQSTCWSPTQH